MNARAASRLAWSFWAVSVGLITTALILLVLDASAPVTSLLGSRVLDAILDLAVLAFPTVGAVIASRRPDNRIGWILCWCGLDLSFVLFASEYSIRALLTHPGSLPWARSMVWIQAWGWFPGVVLFGVYLLLLFPDGRLRSRRWRTVGWMALGATIAATVGTAFAPGTLYPPFQSVANPFGIGGTTGDLIRKVYELGVLLLFSCIVASVVALVLRFGGADPDERQQLKWFATAACILGVGFAAAGTFSLDPSIEPTGWFLVASMVAALGTVAVPVAAGVAVLKYRLYDIDVVIKKSVVLGLLAVFITGVYLGVVVGIGALVGSRRNILLSIVATAIIAVAFQPVRDRASRLADHLVYGPRATPYEVLSDFSKRIAWTYSTEDVLPRMVQTLAAGTGASEARVWLRIGSKLHVAASWPTNDGASSVRIIGNDLPDFPLPERAFAVRHSGELLGAITVVTPPSDPLTPDREKLLNDVAAQTGLVLRNVRLIEELRESRRRIVTAQDERAKALERNLHDGAQQQLVALAVKLRLLENVIPKDPEKAVAMAREVGTEAGDALENLRDLARGIYPPLLADKGLVPALEAQARKGSVPTQVRAEGVSRYSQDIEAAVYFCALEALNNVAKYSGASRAELVLAEAEAKLVFDVSDDGAGFDPAETGYGTGLQGMADRLDAIGGTLEVRSAPGEGTTVAGRIPVPTIRSVM